MSKKTLRILVVLATITVVVTMASMVFAEQNPSAFKNDIQDVSAFNDVGGRIVGALQAIGNIVAIGVLIVLGIKYMMGSAEEKAEYKKTMIPYLIGAALIFAAVNIAQMVYNFATSFNSTSATN